jgi:hypothetical protein
MLINPMSITYIVLFFTDGKLGGGSKLTSGECRQVYRLECGECIRVYRLECGE